MTKSKSKMSVKREAPNGKVRPPKLHTTSTGIEVKIVGCPPLFLDRVRSSVEYPEKPTYEVETATGEIEVLEHDETTLETDEERKEWADYLEAYKKAEDEVSERMFKAVVMRGMEVTIPTDGSWEAFQEWLGVKVPDNQFEKKFAYIQSEVIGNDTDIEDIMSLVMEQTGVPADTIRDVRKSFRDSVEQEEASAGDEGIDESEMDD